MLQRTDEKLSRLMALKMEAIPLARRAEQRKDGTWTPNRWHKELDCGTGHCLLGWFVETETAKADGWEWRRDNDSDYYPAWGEDRNPYEMAGAYFGINYAKASDLFGPFITLDEREATLDRLIAVRMAALSEVETVEA